MRLSGPGFLLGVPVLGGLFTLVIAVILARVGGRLLGIRLRWRRAILAGFPGLMLGWIAAWSINGQRHGPQKLPWPGAWYAARTVTGRPCGIPGRLGCGRPADAPPGGSFLALVTPGWPAGKGRRAG